MENGPFRMHYPDATLGLPQEVAQVRTSQNKVYRVTELILQMFVRPVQNPNQVMIHVPPRRLTEPGSPLQPGSITNRENRFIAHVGQVLTNPIKNRHYVIEEALGQGSYATVFLVRSTRNGKYYAAKVLRNDPNMLDMFEKHEKSILIQLNKLERDMFRQKDAAMHLGPQEAQFSSRIINLKDYFLISQDQPVPVKHLVLIFEKLVLSLHDFIIKNDSQGLSLRMIKRFTRYLLEGLRLMSTQGITHSDIKPENIMLVDLNRYELKLVDFGLARRYCNYESFYIQSRYYRSPEVILQLPLTEAIDMWSLGCTLAELYLSYPLFPGSSNLEVLRFMSQVLGPIPLDLVRSSPVAACYFTKESIETEDGPTDRLRLMTPQEFENTHGYQLPPQQRYHELTGLASLADCYEHSETRCSLIRFDADRALWKPFESLLGRMLEWDPLRRITPAEALNHVFMRQAD